MGSRNDISGPELIRRVRVLIKLRTSLYTSRSCSSSSAHQTVITEQFVGEGLSFQKLQIIWEPSEAIAGRHLVITHQDPITWREMETHPDEIWHLAGEPYGTTNSQPPANAPASISPSKSLSEVSCSQGPPPCGLQQARTRTYTHPHTASNIWTPKHARGASHKLLQCCLLWRRAPSTVSCLAAVHLAVKLSIFFSVLY